MNYNIISTGSKGNAVIIENIILIDCGVSYKALKEVSQNIKIVLLTHIHKDHFNSSAIRKLANDRPSIRWLCGRWLLDDLLACGVNKKQIDIVEFGVGYDYGILKIYPVPLVHNVPNVGYKVFMNGKKLFYATDTGSLDGIEAKDYDLYMIEANHSSDDILMRINDKKNNGGYIYELEAIKNHLSLEKANDFIYSNIGKNGRYVYLHMHEPRKVIHNE